MGKPIGRQVWPYGSLTCACWTPLAPHVPTVKVQVAFYEAFGPAGMEVFAETLREARQRGLIVIADVKRGDIELTAQAYASAYLGQ